MPVGNVLSSYAVNTSMQYNNASGLISKTEAQFKITSQSSSSGDAVLDYYHNLCSKFPDISFRLSDMEESLKHMNDRRPYIGYNDSLNQVGDNYSEMGQVSIDIDAAVIRKMQNNPDFEEEVLAAIENCEKNYGQYQQEAIRNGMPYTDHHLTLDGDRLQESQGYFSSRYSTEEELRRMWDAEEYQTKMGQFFEKQKADLIEIYLQMTESCILKRDEIAPSEQIKEEHRVTYHHYAQPDVVIQGYKVGEENGIPRYRYITTQHGKTISDVTINPETVDPRNATTEEMLALNVYLLEKGVIDEDMQILGSFSEYSGNGRKVNFYETSSEYMQMQYDVGNLSSYMIYRKSLDALAEIINKIDSYKE